MPFYHSIFFADIPYRYEVILLETTSTPAHQTALNVPHHVGISVSSDTFWPGQERYDSFTGYVCNALRGTLKEWQALGALNYEMETAALFVVAQAFGLNAASICGVIAKRTQSESIAPPEIYALASERFGAVAKKALQTLLKGE